MAKPYRYLIERLSDIADGVETRYGRFQVCANQYVSLLIAIRAEIYRQFRTHITSHCWVNYVELACR